MTTFAIFANGTFWGAVDGDTDAEAIQAAADEHGTDGNTGGMTAQPLGEYMLETKYACYGNGYEIAALACEFFNCRDAEVDDKGDLWISGPQNGQWVSDDGKSQFLAWLTQ